LKLLAFALCAAPLARLVWLGFHAGLTANPVEFVTHQTGAWALNLLVAGLCLTPLSRLLKRSEPIKVRRIVGLWAFAYALMHFLIWLVLYNELDWREMLYDVGKRRFITVGFAAFALLIPLAVTSTDGWIRRLGKKWGKLHMLVYPAAMLAVAHYYWLVKADKAWPIRYAVAVGLLLLFRLRAIYPLRAQSQ
jgi:methionine sulfoxide reductase heme-binding subunit